MGKVNQPEQIKNIILHLDYADIRTGWRSFTMTGTKAEFSTWLDKFFDLSDDVFKVVEAGEVKEEIKTEKKEIDYSNYKPKFKKKVKTWEQSFKK